MEMNEYAKERILKEESVSESFSECQFKGEMTKYLFKTQADKNKFELKELNKFYKEVQDKAKDADLKYKSLVRVKKNIRDRILELQEAKKNGN